MEENSLTPNDYLAMVARRKMSIIIPFLVIACLSGLLAFLLPSIYKSTSTILIEQREIPAEYVQSSMTTYAEQRMQSINQRVLTSAKLLTLIDQFDLYTDLKKKKTIDEIISKMRDNIVLKPVNVDIADRRSGRTAIATIAFTLSFEGKNPKKVQQVANTITSLFLQEDLKVRKDQASSTFEFLRVEKERIGQKVADIEKTLANFKQENVHSLPEMFQVNMQTLNSLQRGIDDRVERLRSLNEQKSELEEQLANTPETMEDTLQRRDLREDDERRLESLKMQLINLKTQFSDLYPDVKKLKQEIKDLTIKVESSKKEIEKEPTKNPAFVTLSVRLAGIRSAIVSVQNNIKDLEKEANVYRERVAATPGIEEKYNVLLTEKTFQNRKLADLQAKMMEAQVAEELESKQKGERFTLVESARFPEKPYKPNRIAIILIGLVLGLGGGIGLAALMEFSDTSFRDADALSRFSGFPVLTEVPMIVTREDSVKRNTKKLIIIGIVILGIALAIYLFHTYVMDLAVLQAKIMRQLG